ncbi:MAG: KamA family radical SAM protein [Planctomycetia bacterium]|nr:KamA family radical SAM protein [Planctomycetia bacterium]
MNIHKQKKRDLIPTGGPIDPAEKKNFFFSGESDLYYPFFPSDFITDPFELCALLDLPRSLAASALSAAGRFPMKIPRSLLNRMEKGDPNDPILIQFLPRKEETLFHPGFSPDPLEEKKTADQNCILQKYQGRALILTTDRCAASCRYCFRRCLPKGKSLAALSRSVNSAQILQSIHDKDDLKEIILSGGDPCSLSDQALKILFHYIKTIPSVNRVRIHSRLPILVPSRINSSFCDLFRENFSSEKNFTFSVVFQINHPNEINSEVRSRLKDLHKTGILMMSQSVLLKGINDSPDILAELFEKLIDIPVVPYYLHQLDRVEGAAEFEVSTQKGLKIMEDLKKLLPGYAVPRYVREIPGEPCKKEIRE